MGLEYRIRPLDVQWFAQNRDRVAETVRTLPSFVEEKPGDEFWLKHSASDSSWAFDVRVFIEDDSLFVEISSNSGAFYEDVRALYERLAQDAGAVVEDADDPDETVEPSRLFQRP